MIVPLEKPGTPAELNHHGVLGMKWGHHSTNTSSSTPKAPMSKKKKIAIGVAVGATVVAGAAATAIILKKTGHLPVSPLSNRRPMVVHRLLAENGNTKLSRRELKRYHKFAAQGRVERVKMASARAMAARNIARAQKPDLYVRDNFGNYVPRVYRRPV